MNYEPGTVAVATVRGVPNVRVIRDDRKDAWLSGATIDGFQFHVRTQVTDVRPLVVLDVGDSEFAAKMMIETLCIAQARISGSIVDLHRKRSDIARLQALIDQIEAQTKPPRIPEPPAFGAEVTAGQKGAPVPRRWIRAYSNPAIGSHPWTDGNHLARWDDLIDPVLVRPGIEDES